MEALDKTAVEAIAELTRAGGEPVAMTVEGPRGEKVAVFAMPKHLANVDMDRAFDEARGYPKRAKGSIFVDSLEAFTAMVNRHASTSTVIYAHNDKQKPSLVAVLNDHGGLNPGFRDHRVAFYPQLSEAWQAWVGSNERSFSQGDFAAFLEDHSLDVIDPSDLAPGKIKSIVDSLGVVVANPASLRTLAKDFSVRVKQQVREARSLATGETQVIFVTEHAGEDGKPMTVPGAFLIAIPVYENGIAYRVVARLRYRVTEGKITWSYKLTQAEESKAAVMADMRAKAWTDTGCVVIEGQAS